MLKIAVVFESELEQFLKSSSDEGKTYSWVIRKALTEFVEKQKTLQEKILSDKPKRSNVIQLEGNSHEQ